MVFSENSYTMYKKAWSRTLEKLGTPKEYHTIQNLIKLMLIIYFIVILILFVADSILNIEKHHTTI